MKTTATSSTVSTWISRTLLCGCLFATTLFIGGIAQAQTDTWTGGGTTSSPASGTWDNSTTGNWSTAGIWKPGDTAIFGGTGTVAVNVAAPISANLLQFTSSTGNYTLTASAPQTITLSDGNWNSDGSHPSTGAIELANGVTATIGANVTVNGSSNIEVDSTSGSTGGTLDVNGTLSTSGGASLMLSNATVVVNTGGSYTTNGGIFIGNGNIGGTLTVNGGSVTEGAGQFLSVGWQVENGGGGALSIVNVDAGTLNTGGATGQVVLGNGFAGTTGELFLNGGTFQTGHFGFGGSANIFFNGGTVQALTNDTGYLNGASAAYVGGTASTINNGGNNITIGQNLLTGDGITGSTAPASGLDGGMIFTGSGTTTLSGSSSYTGGTTVNGGTLLLNGSGGPTGTIIGALTINSGGTVSVDAGSWRLGFGGANSSVSAITINGGTLNFTGGVNGGTDAGAITMTGGTISGTSFDWYNGITNSPTLTTNASSTQATISSGFAIRWTNAGTLTITDAQGTVPGGAPDLLISGAIVENAGNVGGQNGGITKAGLGTLQLSGNNNYTGATIVNAGTLILSGSNAATNPNGNGTVAGTTLNGGATLQLQANGNNTSAGVSSALTGNGSTFTFNSGGTLQLLSNSSVTFAGGNNLAGASGATYNFYVNNNGSGSNQTISFGTGGFGISGTTINVTGGNGYTLALGTLASGGNEIFNPTTANVTIAGLADNSGSGSNFQLGGTSNGNSVTGAISDNGTGGTSVTMSGSGKWTLAGINTYGGATTVNSGTLIITGSTVAGSAVTVNGGILNVPGTVGGSVAVNGGGTLLGSGTVGGLVTVAGGASGAGGTIDARNGNTGGNNTLSLGGGLTLGGTAGNFSNLNFGVAAGTADNLAITGVLTVNIGGADITITNDNLNSGQTYTLATFTSGAGSGFATGSGTTVGDFTLLNPQFSFGLSGSLTVTSTALELVTSGGVVPTTAYWSGANGTAWNSTSGSNGNFTTDAQGTNFLNVYPNGTTTVIFAANGATNLSTPETLGQAFSVAGLQFLATENNSTTVGAINVTDTTVGNTLTIGSGGISDANTNGVTLNPYAVIPSTSQTWTNSSAAALNIGAVTGAANSGTTLLTISNTAGGATNLNGVIGDGTNGGNLALQINSSGAGVTTLGAANIFTGGTTLTAGTLALGNASGLSTGAVTVNGGTLDLAGFNPTIANLQGSGGTILNNGAADTLTVNSGNYSGVITNGSGALALTKATAGSLTLSGSNSYTGATNVSGTLQLQANAGNTNGSNISFALGGSNNLTLNSGTTLQLLSNSSVTFNGGDNLQGATGATYTFNVDNNGSGTNNTINFATTSGFAISGTTINVTGGDGYTLALGTLASSGNETFNPTSASLTIAGVTGSASQTITLGGTSSGNSITGAITGSGLAISETGSGAWTLSGNNIYTGATTVTNGGTLTITGTNSGNGSYDSTGGTLTIGSTGVVDASSLTNGTTNVNGTLVMSGNISNGSMAFNNGTLQAVSNVVINGGIPISLTGANTVNIATGDSVTMESGFNSGTGSLTVTGGGTLNAQNAFSNNGYTGITTITGGSTVQIIQDGDLGTAPGSAVANQLTLNNGDLQFGNTPIFGFGGDPNLGITVATRGITLSNGTTDTIDAESNGTVQGIITGGGSLTTIGSGTLTLSANETYTGATNVNGGTLILSGSNHGVATGAMTVNSGGTLQLQANAGNTDVNNISYALSGNNNNLTLNNGATLQMLSDSSVTFTGGDNFGGLGGATITFNVNQLTSAGSNQTISFAPGGFAFGNTTFNVTGGNGYTLALGILNSGAANSITFNPTTANVTVAGVTGGAVLTKLGSGTLTLSGNNTYGVYGGGGTVVAGGTLNANSATALGLTTNSLTVSSSNSNGGSGPVVLNLFNTPTTTVGSLSGTTGAGGNTATINIAAGDNLTVNQTTLGTFGGVIAGSGSFTLGSLSTNTLTLSGVNTYSGDTTVSAGTLAFSGVGALGTGNLTVNGTGTVDLEGSTQTVDALNDSSAGGTITSFGTNGGNGSGFSTLIVGSGGGSGTYGGSIQDGFAFGTALVKTGSGTQVLTGTNSTYSGGTTILGGVLSISSEANIGDGNDSFNDFPGGYLSGGNGVDLPFGGITLGGGELLTSATTTLAEGVSLNTGTTNTLAAATGTTATYNNVLADGNGSGALTIGDSLGNNGTVVLTGANTYTGGTTVSSGSLYVNNGGGASYAPPVSQPQTITANNITGSGTGTGSVTVQSGGTLAGSGTITPTSGSGVTVQSGGTLASGAVQTNVIGQTGQPSNTGYNVTSTGLTLNNTAALSSVLTVNGGATLSFDLGAGTNTGAYAFANPNTNSTYISVVGDTAGEITFGTSAAINIDLVDLTAFDPKGTPTLTLRFHNPYLLIQADSNSDYNLITSLNGVLSVDGNGYVVGVGTSTSSYTANAFNLAVYNINGVQVNSPTNLGGLNLYLYNGDLEVVPEPGTWALMLGGLALLVFIQRRRANRV